MVYVSPEIPFHRELSHSPHVTSDYQAVPLSQNWIFLLKSLGLNQQKQQRINDDANELANDNATLNGSMGVQKSKKKYPPATALDCEMVGSGIDGAVSVLARVSIVDEDGNVLLDSYVSPKCRITDFRTAITGLTWQDLRDGEAFDDVRKRVLGLLRGRIVVGHGLENDFKCLNYFHPRGLVRDTSNYKPLHPCPSKTWKPKLQTLVKHWLKIDIQNGAHDSVVDARMAMRLYHLRRKEWEKRYASLFVTPVAAPLSIQASDVGIPAEPSHLDAESVSINAQALLNDLQRGSSKRKNNEQNDGIPATVCLEVHAPESDRKAVKSSSKIRNKAKRLQQNR